jgi:hypothetical protein
LIKQNGGQSVRNSITAVLFLSAALATAETAYYRIELSPSGSMVAIGAPVVKGTTLLFHGYPDGKLMSLRKSDVKSVTPITAQEATAPPKKNLVSIGNLAMQGGSATITGGASGATSRGASGATAGSAVRPTTATTTAHAATSGPSVINTPDGLAVTTAPPK